MMTMLMKLMKENLKHLKNNEKKQQLINLKN
jgi:hypothetical protein